MSNTKTPTDPRHAKAIENSDPSEVNKLPADPESERQCSTCANDCVCKNIRGDDCKGYVKKYKEGDK